MKTKLVVLSALILSLAAGFTACKKSDNSLTNENDNEISVHSADEARFESEMDAVVNDVNISLESEASMTGRFMGIQGVICDADVTVNTTANPMTLTIVYNGSNCLGTRTRTGTVVVSMPQGTQWKRPGAAVTVSFQQLKITRVRDNKSITINGTQTYTNVSGGLLGNLASLGTITRTVTSPGLSLTFDDGSQRSWQVAKQRVFTYNNGLVVTSSGMHTEGGVTNIAAWGTNRFGNSFTTAFTTPLVIRQDCDFRITTGVVTHVTPRITASATFGLDASGNPTGCPGTGTYYYKLAWTIGNRSNSIILPY